MVWGTVGYAASLKVGMVTDAGTIDDKSFNQGTWEGVLRAQKELGVKVKYLKPGGTTEADYLKEISNLYDAGYRCIVTPGFKFETSIYKAQAKYPKAKFVLLDGQPHKGDYAPDVKKNTVAILFAEHEAGFMAGVAAALQIKKGDVGFIGGMEIPAVQRFNWGFQQGVAYSNETYGTTVNMNPDNFVYQGTFSDVAAGQQLAASMFDRDVNVVFAAAGGVGVGVINEAKSRARGGEPAWVVGVDVDQYPDGIYDGTHSIILTSATKKIANATFDMVKADLEGSFPGGQTMIFNASNDGVGLPAENPNLREDVQKKMDQIFAKIKSGEIKVSKERGDLFR
ncbi:MAG: BMP family ABC transporter substrate-binding protein [Dethiosulfovibrio peptidovorans]|nr:MAG: BMP family ABC transporter substrate-binding protein [Dethiosulfovibrio peptidovorans]